MRAVCFLADKWLHTTPSRALVLLSESDEIDDMDVMLAYKNWEASEQSWAHVSRENKIKFIEVVRVLRRRERRVLDDVNEEYEAVMAEAMALAQRHHGDPNTPPDDDLETRIAQKVANEVQPQRVAARFGRT